jgi:hypothetical protein
MPFCVHKHFSLIWVAKAFLALFQTKEFILIGKWFEKKIDLTVVLEAIILVEMTIFNAENIEMWF